MINFIKNMFFNLWRKTHVPIKIISIIWVILTLSLIHIVKMQGQFFTAKESTQVFESIRKEMFGDSNMSVIELKSEEDEEKFNQKFDEVRDRYLCETNSGVDFTYTCKNKVVDFIVDYIPFMLTVLIFGLLSFSPIFLIGLVMLIPYVVVIKLVIKKVKRKKEKND